MTTTSQIVSSFIQYVVQDTWNEEEDQELRDYLEGIAADNSNVDLSYLSKEETLRLPPNANTVLFVDSSLVQTLLQSQDISIIDTYPSVFNHLYRRRITETTLSSCESKSGKMKFPYFVKLLGSNKDFAARVVHTAADHYAMIEAVGTDTPVYLCEVVDFVAEFRLFLSPTQVWAACEYSEYMIGHRLLNQAPTKQDSTDSDTTSTMKRPLVVEEVHQVPPDFVKQVWEASKGLNTFCVVDVGLTAKGEWSVVECNPPFALSSYDLDMKTYVDYCTQAWQHMFASSRSTS